MKHTLIIGSMLFLFGVNGQTVKAQQRSSSCGSCQTSQFASKKNWTDWTALGKGLDYRISYFYCNESSVKKNMKPHYWYFEIRNNNSVDKDVSYAIYTPGDDKPKWRSTTIKSGDRISSYESTWSYCHDAVRVHVK